MNHFGKFICTMKYSIIAILVAQFLAVPLVSRASLPFITGKCTQYEGSSFFNSNREIEFAGDFGAKSVKVCEAVWGDVAWAFSEISEYSDRVCFFKRQRFALGSSDLHTDKFPIVSFFSAKVKELCPRDYEDRSFIVLLEVNINVEDLVILAEGFRSALESGHGLAKYFSISFWDRYFRTEYSDFIPDFLARRPPQASDPDFALLQTPTKATGRIAPVPA